MVAEGVQLLRERRIRARPLPKADRSEGILPRTQRKDSVGEVFHEVKCRLSSGGFGTTIIVFGRFVVGARVLVAPQAGATRNPRAVSDPRLVAQELFQQRKHDELWLPRWR